MLDEIRRNGVALQYALFHQGTPGVLHIVGVRNPRFLGGVNLRKSRKSRKFQGNLKKIYKMIVLILVH